MPSIVTNQTINLRLSADAILKDARSTNGQYTLVTSRNQIFGSTRTYYITYNMYVGLMLAFQRSIHDNTFPPYISLIPKTFLRFIKKNIHVKIVANKP